MSLNSSSKKKVAVFFGAPSPEHDVSVVTGLQILKAINPQTYDAFPVYIAPDGRWFVGEALRARENFLFDRESIKALTPVTLDVNRAIGSEPKGRLLHTTKKLFGDNVAATFDIAIPAFHGLYGEDGNFQGLMEMAGIPYAGMRTMASSIAMDKIATKRMMQSLSIPVLPFAEIRRPLQGSIVPLAEIEGAMKAAKIKFPCILKPTHLGSSIGVAKVTSAQEIAACLPAIFALDDSAILEPFVENLVEYNVAVARIDGTIRTSAIERPKATEELLDFKQKYLSGGGGKSGSKSGTKTNGQASQGMLSLTRELNPPLPPETKEKIILWVTTMFDALAGTGAPRVDCIANGKTGEIWLNEINPFPGSIGYFLWEAAEEEPLLFSELLTHLIEEALRQNSRSALPKDPVPKDARLLKRALSESW